MKRGIQSLLSMIFTASSLVIVLLFGILFFTRFQSSARQAAVANSEMMLEQTGENLEDYLVSMRKIADAAAYDVISENEINSAALERELYLLYEANSDSIRSIAIYDSYGSLLVAEPVANQKEDPNITTQAWFSSAISEMENYHFSMPHIQTLFDDGTKQYHRVISVSRMVDLVDGETPRTGVLLVDMNFSEIRRMMEQINNSTTSQYYYLCDSEGNLIYHPKQMQIEDGLRQESTESVVGLKDGVYTMNYLGERSNIVVRNVSYTGWKLVSVIPNSSLASSMMNNNLILVIVLLLTLMMVVMINRIAVLHISSPILQLNDSVRAYEAGGRPRIFVGGPPEISHLGVSIQKSYEEIEHLMDQVVAQEKLRRKSEFAALQSQINPHFLYNTLDSITWMIEGERNEEASFMITQLARLLRISLSKGRTVISVDDEIRHAESYMNIQKIRYKESFQVHFDVKDDLREFCTVKLILQPLLENAIYYGVEGLDDGEITISGWKDGDDLCLQVKDNGIGMPEEVRANCLTDAKHVPARGSGVGMRNVHDRIQILYGEKYGLTVWSEPDEGTEITIRIPAIPYSEENRKSLEAGKIPELEQEVEDEE